MLRDTFALPETLTKGVLLNHLDYVLISFMLAALIGHALLHSIGFIIAFCFSAILLGFLAYLNTKKDKDTSNLEREINELKGRVDALSFGKSFGG